jgi:hypothetical protein
VISLFFCIDMGGGGVRSGVRILYSAGYGMFDCYDASAEYKVYVTPPNNFNKFGGVTTLQDNNKTKPIKNICINLKDQSKRKQRPTFNLNQRV